LSKSGVSWIEPLVEAFERPAFQLAVLLVEDPSTAQEIVQEAFVRVWESTRTPQEPSHFRPWLYKVILNLARDYHRKRVRWNRLRLLNPIPRDPQVEVERRMSVAAIERAMQHLNRRDREVLYLRFFEDATYAEVARILGSHEGATRVMLHRALERLRRQLVADGMAPTEVRHE